MSKAKGSRAERKTIRVLEADGYVCTKAGGSLGVFDVIALGHYGVKAIQVKAGTGRLSRKEREAIASVKVPGNCSKELWTWADYARSPKIEVLA